MRVIAPGTSRLTGAAAAPRVLTVTGRGIASVTFYVDGRRVGTVRAKPGRTSFVIRVPKLRSRLVHQATARVTYRSSTGTPTVTRRTTFRGPRRAPATPRFTG